MSAVSSPRDVSIRQSCPSLSQVARLSSVAKRTCGITPWRSAQSFRYSRISSCGENVLDQFGFGANENE
jgi:hypothetical protein